MEFGTLNKINTQNNYYLPVIEQNLVQVLKVVLFINCFDSFKNNRLNYTVSRYLRNMSNA
jgi:hypothetical protein